MHGRSRLAACLAASCINKFLPAAIDQNVRSGGLHYLKLKHLAFGRAMKAANLPAYLIF